MRGMVIGFKQQLEKDYNILSKASTEFDFTLTELIEMRLMKSSRVFNLEINGHPTIVAVPFGDMLNHSSSPNSKYTYDNKRGGFTIHAC